MDFLFILNSLLLGVGLAMDAFSVSVANGFAFPKMKKSRICAVAGTYAIFQFLMPMLGWFCVHTVVGFFGVLEKFVPYVALILLLYIGIKMIIGCLHGTGPDTTAVKKLSFGDLMVQGIATSIDALSVGLTIEQYSTPQALTASLIIGAVTFVLCSIGIVIGKKFGQKFGKAELIGGIILIAIGIEIFIRGVFFS